MMNDDELKRAAELLLSEHRLPDGISIGEHAAITQLAGLFSDNNITERERAEEEERILQRYEKERRK